MGGSVILGAARTPFGKLGGGLARFPAVELARGALQAGESAPAVLNAANEVAVAAFLAGRAAFPAIVETVEKVLAAHRPAALASLDDALAWDAWGRERAAEVLGS